uniref:Uncharacterized protein n=1 Tax=Romanomermis culicivorax TaxID=13658 RepID=A0A915I7A3_ROMCU
MQKTAEKLPTKKKFLESDDGDDDESFNNEYVFQLQTGRLTDSGFLASLGQNFGQMFQKFSLKEDNQSIFGREPTPGKGLRLGLKNNDRLPSPHGKRWTEKIAHCSYILIQSCFLFFHGISTSNVSIKQIPNLSPPRKEKENKQKGKKKKQSNEKGAVYYCLYGQKCTVYLRAAFIRINT